MTGEARPLHVSLVAIPDAVVSTLTGIYDVLNAFRMLGRDEPSLPAAPPFAVEIVSSRSGPVSLASGMPVEAQRAVSDIGATHIIIVPSILLGAEGWKVGRYPELVAWARRMHGQGALLCSACSGLFLLAETGVFDGQNSTVHWAYAAEFAKVFPNIPLHPERVLVVSGKREELVTSGASMTWHDLVLYLIARHVGATAAQTVARSFALQWHHDGLTPYIVFQGRKDHGDAAIAVAQTWLSTHFSVGSPVEEMVRLSGLAERTFKRRFREATGFAPIDYVQRLRIEDAKRRLERTDAPAEQISWQVGYEDAAFFRRLFKRMTGLTPGAYRRRFQLPEFARPGGIGDANDPSLAV
jgi:transcriptional regulator GlxA family with amidase domain